MPSSSGPTTSTFSAKVDNHLVQALAQGMMRLMKPKLGGEVQSADSGAFTHFAGTASLGTHSSISCAVFPKMLGSWIIDTGASDHMTFDPTLFSHTKTLPHPISVTLPDGSIKPVTIIGDIPLSCLLYTSDAADE